MLVAERNLSLGQYDEELFVVNNVRNISLPLQPEPGLINYVLVLLA